MPYQDIEKEADIEWYQINMNWLKKFIKLMEAEITNETNNI
jgi:hypothetical protein